MGIKAKIKTWFEKLLAKVEKWVKEQNAEADAAREAEWEGPVEDYNPAAAQEVHDALYDPAVPLKACVRASCWDGNNAEKRFMNMVSPKFSDSKFGEYLAWTLGKGCDHVHLLLMNEGDGEGSGYDSGDPATLAKVEARIMTIRSKGLGVILWIVADDSSSYRKKLFSDPGKYVGRMAPLFRFASCVCLGLEMDEGGATEANWKAVKSALLKVWSGPVATHHTSGKYSFIGLGEVVMDQLDPKCTAAQITASVQKLRAKGKTVFGFEYARHPDAAKAKAALEAGAQGVGNWAGGSTPATAPANSTTTAGDAEDSVPFGELQWSYGGFKGGSAKLSAKARIMGLSVKSDGMSYQWMSGGCENLGASSSTDASCLACLFCLVGGRWVGGKFDWISTSRRTRDFANIRDGYNGWPKDSVSKAAAFAFCIVSKDGKTRTNVIRTGA